MDAFVLRENAIPQKFKQFTCRPADPTIYDGMGQNPAWMVHQTGDGTSSIALLSSPTPESMGKDFRVFVICCVWHPNLITDHSATTCVLTQTGLVRFSL